MFRVTVMFIALCRLPGRWLWEACHLAGRYSWTRAWDVTWPVSGIHRDAVGAWKREKPSWVGLPQSKHRLVFYFFSQAGIWPSSYLHSVLSLARSDFSPTAWSVHRDITMGCCLALHPSPHGSWRGECFLAWNDGGKQGGVGPTLWPIAGLLLWPWIWSKWRKDGGPSAGSEDQGGQRPNWSSPILIGLLQGWGSDAHPWEQVCLPSELGPHESFSLNLTVLDTVLSLLSGLYWKKKKYLFLYPFPPAFHIVGYSLLKKKNGNKQKVLGTIINESESEICFP